MIKYTINQNIHNFKSLYFVDQSKIVEKEVQFISKSVTSTIHHVYVTVYRTYCTLTRLKLFFFKER